VTSAAFKAAGQDLWLSQGDVFRDVLISRIGVANSSATADLDRGPALLMTPDCVLDKKEKVNHRQVPQIDFLTFLPIRGFVGMNTDRARTLREKGAALELGPYGALYLGEIDNIGECWVSLAHPYAIPVPLLGTELQSFTAEQTGDKADERLVALIGDTRIGRLTPEGITLLEDKWMALWTGRIEKPKPSAEA